MGVNQNQGQDPNQYGGYTGYTPPSQPIDPDDPYADPNYGQQSGSTGTAQGYASGQQQQQQYQTGQQQQQYYQPPNSAGGRSGGALPGVVVTARSRNAAMLSNLFLFLGGIFFFIKERRDRFVRFYAAQSFLFFGGVTIVYVILRLITAIPVVGFLLSPILGCAIWVLLVPTVLIWVFLMFQSYRGTQFKLPVVGDYAEALVNRFTKK